MITTQVTLPEETYAEFVEAANQLQKELLPPGTKVTPNTLMAFALCRHDAATVCAQFDLTLRAITGESRPANPVLS